MWQIQIVVTPRIFKNINKVFRSFSRAKQKANKHVQRHTKGRTALSFALRTTTDHLACGTCKSSLVSNQLITVDEKGDTSTQPVSVPILGYSLLASRRSAAAGGGGQSHPHTLGRLLLLRLILVVHPCHFARTCVRAVVESVAGDTGAGGWSSDINTGEVPPRSRQLLFAPPPLWFLASGCRRSSFDDINTHRNHSGSAAHGSEGMMLYDGEPTQRLRVFVRALRIGLLPFVQHKSTAIMPFSCQRLLRDDSEHHHRPPVERHLGPKYSPKDQRENCERERERKKKATTVRTQRN